MAKLEETKQTDLQSDRWGYWKKIRDEMVTPEVVRAMWQALARDPRGLIPPPDSAMMFVSPAANTANNEEEIFNEDSKTRKGVATFVVGDIADLGTSKGRLMQYGKSTFEYVIQDAATLIERTEPNSVDIFWDTYGYVWSYMAYRSATTERFLEMMRGIHTVLKPGGCVVFDHYPNPLEREFSDSDRQRFPHLRDLKMRKHAPSTFEAIDLQPARDGETMWTLLQDMFKVTTVGSGITQLLVLQKKNE